jgi:dolichol-phosphate mannosyltransferase
MAVFWAAFGVPFPGFGSIIALNLLMFGFVFLFMGIISEYVGMVYEEVRQRPLYIIAEKVGFTE